MHNSLYHTCTAAKQDVRGHHWQTTEVMSFEQCICLLRTAAEALEWQQKDFAPYRQFNTCQGLSLMPSQLSAIANVAILVGYRCGARLYGQTSGRMSWRRAPRPLSRRSRPSPRLSGMRTASRCPCSLNIYHSPALHILLCTTGCVTAFWDSSFCFNINVSACQIWPPRWLLASSASQAKLAYAILSIVYMIPNDLDYQAAIVKDVFLYLSGARLEREELPDQCASGG
jgi:hypothetical protein